MIFRLASEERSEKLRWKMIAECGLNIKASNRGKAVAGAPKKGLRIEKRSVGG
jgi:hypothetical protein